jgi:Domain of unknown function (DUF4190)
MSVADDFEPCPFCDKPVSKTAERCRHCGKELYEEIDEPRPRQGGDASLEEGLKWLLPISRSGWAIAAGYLGLFAIVPVLGLIFGLLAILCGVLGIREMKRKPRLSGQGRAIFGIIMGSLSFILHVIAIVGIVASGL